MMPPGVSSVPSEWFRGILNATALLSVGGVLLLVGWLGWFLMEWTNETTLWILGCGWAALGVHLFAWARLGLAITDAPGDGLGGLKARMAAVFAASLVGFSVGLVTLPAAFPEPAGWGGILGVYLTFYGAFPYVPSVYAPVAIAHASIFLLVARAQANRRHSFATIAGSCILMLVSLTGLLFQIAFREALFPVLRTPMWILAGLTSFGYLIVFRSFRRERGVLRERPITVAP